MEELACEDFQDFGVLLLISGSGVMVGARATFALQRESGFVLITAASRLSLVDPRTVECS
jgi:hypothetical protein